MALEEAYQEALNRKDSARVVALAEEKLRRKGAPSAAEIQAKGPTAERERKATRRLQSAITAAVTIALLATAALWLNAPRSYSRAGTNNWVLVHEQTFDAGQEGEVRHEYVMDMASVQKVAALNVVRVKRIAKYPKGWARDESLETAYINAYYFYDCIRRRASSVGAAEFESRSTPAGELIAQYARTYPTGKVGTDPDDPFLGLKGFSVACLYSAFQ